MRAFVAHELARPEPPLAPLNAFLDLLAARAVASADPLDARLVDEVRALLPSS